MHQEGMACPSGMAAVLGMDAPALEALCAEATARARAESGDAAEAEAAHPGLGRVVLANDNAPGQIVISGAQRALVIAMELARERGARKVVPLAVSGAFHSPVMAPAAVGLAPAAAVTPLRDARVPVIANTSAQPLTQAADIRAELAQQIESPVQWTRSIEYMATEGISTVVEVGAGQVLAGLIKRIARGMTTIPAGSAEQSPAPAANPSERPGAQPSRRRPRDARERT